MLKAKSTVNLKECGFEIGYAARIIEVIYKSYGVECILTSGDDSKHSSNSLHYKGNAIDIRTKNIPANSLLLLIVGDIKRELEILGFDVVFEGDHLHVEYDPKANEKFLEIVN